VVSEFRQLFPHMKVQDVLYYSASSRPGVKNLLGRKLEQGRTPVYNYLFTWEYPINGGITAFHCAEIAFCFHALDVPQIALATGNSPEARQLQDKVAQAWVNFAKNGNPSQPGLEWKPYTPDDPQAMIFDATSQSVSLRDDRLVTLITSSSS
jgi:para-nitrobenzyl esterase